MVIWIHIQIFDLVWALGGLVRIWKVSLLELQIWTGDLQCTMIFSWDDHYDRELVNFNDMRDEGDIWFGCSSEERIINQILQVACLICKIDDFLGARVHFQPIDVFRTHDHPRLLLYQGIPSTFSINSRPPIFFVEWCIRREATCICWCFLTD